MIPFLRKVHLCLAFASAFFLLNLCLSGALLLYAKDIQSFVNPQSWTVEPQQQVLTYNQLIKVIEEQAGQKVTLIMLAQDERQAWQFRLADNSYINVDPYQGKILSQYGYYDSFYGFVMSWHRWLLWIKADGSKPLQDLVSVTALLLMINMLVGFWLWCKPKARLKRLKIKRTRNRKIWLNQLHTTLGVHSLLPLLLIAISGMAFNWQDPVKFIVESLALSTIEQAEAPVLAQYSNESASGRESNLDLAVKNGLAAMPEASLYRIYVPQEHLSPLRLRVKMPTESYAFSWIWLNPGDNRVLNTYNAAEASLATRVWHFKYKFHIGEFFHPLLKVLWLILALMPILFIVSGLWLYLHKVRHKRQRLNDRMENGFKKPLGNAR